MTAPESRLDATARWRIDLTEVGAQPLCIALANTCERRGTAQAVERLESGEDLVAFGRAQGLFDDAAATALRAHVDAHPRAARAELAAALALREAIVRVLPAPDSAPNEDRDLLARTFDEALQATALELRERTLVARPRSAEARLSAVRLQAAVSAMALLASAVGARVRRCADDRGCARLFVDTTRNGSRRYCLAGECGNRARQAAFRARRRARHA